MHKFITLRESPRCSLGPLFNSLVDLYQFLGKYKPDSKNWRYVHVDDMREKGRYMHIVIPYDGGYGPYTHESWPYVHYEPKYEATTPYGSYRYLFHLPTPPTRLSFHSLSLSLTLFNALALPPSSLCFHPSLVPNRAPISDQCAFRLRLLLPATNFHFESIHLIKGVKIPLSSRKEESYDDNHLVSGRGQPTFHLRSIDFRIIRMPPNHLPPSPPTTTDATVAPLVHLRSGLDGQIRTATTGEESLAKNYAKLIQLLSKCDTIPMELLIIISLSIWMFFFQSVFFATHCRRTRIVISVFVHIVFSFLFSFSSWSSFDEYRIVF